MSVIIKVFLFNCCSIANGKMSYLLPDVFLCLWLMIGLKEAIVLIAFI